LDPSALSPLLLTLSQSWVTRSPTTHLLVVPLWNWVLPSPSSFSRNTSCPYLPPCVSRELLSVSVSVTAHSRLSTGAVLVSCCSRKSFKAHVYRTVTDSNSQLDHDHPYRRSHRWSHHGHHAQHPQLQQEVSWSKCDAPCEGSVSGATLVHVPHYGFMACFLGPIELFHRGKISS
jgi:hypothetical protein